MIYSRLKLLLLFTNYKMASSVQGMRTFGDKPKAFQLEEGGELYYVGSEVMMTAILL